MTNKVIYKLKGHEKFPLREGWINKGLSVAKEKGTHIFLESQGPDMLGVGTNMVKSIRYWMQACGLLVKDGNKEILSDMAEIIYMNDPYLEDIFSLWILHSNITKNIEQATVWYMFFNRFNVDSFNKADMQKKMQQELFNYVGQQVTESSLKDDIDVLLNMYSKGDNKNEDPEDKIISPFSTLGIIKKEDETYYKIQPDLRRIANELVLYEISSLLDHNKSISIETIASGERSLGAIYNMTSDVRNRIEALLMTTNATSWKCIDQEFRVIPPEEKRARKVYDSIVTKINENKEYACKDIFDRFCRPPYGMSEDVVVLMIAVVCANLNYCLRFRCDESLTNINSWKELVVIKDKKIDIDVVKKSAFVMVDAGAVTGKYVRFFERIQSNKSISEVISLEKILANMMAVDEIPEELETQYLLARKYLDSGKKANNEWKTCIGEIDEKLEASIEESNLYDALKGLQLVEAIPYTKIFKDNGYELDEESKNTVKELISSLKSEVEQLITPYLANMYCKSVEGVNTFRNHNTKMQNMLEELGFTNYAMQVKRRKEEELSNIDEIRSRQELRADCEKYLEESQITRYVTYVNVCLYLKSGKELQARVKKYGVALGKDAQKIQENINDRVAALEKNHDRTMQDMSDIWDDLYEVKNADDVEMLIDNIASVLQKGIPDADRLDFEELQKNLSELLNDINEIKRVTNSRNEFKKISEDMINKYEHSEFDFEVLPIIHEVISDMENNMNVREQEWINSVLTLGDKSRKAVHKWKEKTAYLPEYLSEETIEKVKMVDKEADEIISEGKIEDVLFYFDKLDDVEKLECIQKLQNRLNR